MPSSSIKSIMPTIICTVCLTLSHCPSDSAEKIQDREETVALLNLLRLPTDQDVIHSCEASHQAGLNCSSTGGSQSEYERAFRIAFALPASSSVTSTCAQSAQKEPVIPGINPPLPELSAGSKICYFECSRQYWQSIDCSSSYNINLANWKLCSPANRETTCSIEPIRTCLSNCLDRGTVYWYIPGTAN